jgi:hypothetical protein
MTNKVKIFTSSGTFTPKADKDNRVHKGEYTKHEGAYIQASGGEETIVHDKCGTPDCCQRCESAEPIQWPSQPISAYSHIKRRTQ